MIAIPFLMGAAAGIGAEVLGAGAFIALSAFTVGTMLGQYLFPTKMNTHDMKPASLSDFTYTQANEGAPVPLIGGTVKIAGNIIWYGNLVTEEQTQKVSGGKGSHSSNVVTGYKYYIDVWVSLSLGQVSILDTYNNEKKETIIASSTNFNDGTGTYYPTLPGQYASRLNGIAHIFYDRLYIGESTSIPTINYILKRSLPSSLTYNNDTNGSNPASFVYDILVSQIGIASVNIDITSFNAAATTYYNDGLGINVAFTSQKTGEDMIQYIMQFVNSVCYKDQTTGLYKIEVME